MVSRKSRFAEAFEAHLAAERLAAKKQFFRHQASETEARRAKRVDHAEPAALLTEAGVKAATVRNLSVTGALILQSEGEMPAVGEVLNLRLFDDRHIQARVAWVNGSNLGLNFDDELSSLDEIMHFEARGPSVFRALVHRPTKSHS